jgi:hypothetical protein
MRNQLLAGVLAVTFALGGLKPAEAQTDTVSLTGGFISAYLGDRGGGVLTGNGFSVDGYVDGCCPWPISVRPGKVVDFSGGWTLGNWGNATVNGTRLHGDPSDPGGGRLWIVGSVQATAKPFIAPAPSAFTGGFSAPVTIAGRVSGYYNSDTTQPPLFTVDVVGNGAVGGAYRMIDNGGGDIFYLDNCCAGLTISALPQPWTYADIGAVGQKGSAAYAKTPSPDNVETYTVKSAGSDIWGTQDSFGYLYQPFDGDGWITMDVKSLQNTHPFAKVGVMLRESLDPSSRHVILDIRPNGMTEFMTRSSTGGATTFLGSGLDSANLALYRNGSVVTGYTFGDGWRRTVGSTTIAMGQHLYAGVAVTSHDPTTLTTATFGPPAVHNYAFKLPAGWSDADIGNVGKAGVSSYDAGTFTVHGAGADIWDSVDAFHFVFQSMHNDGQIVARVTGVENTNPFAKAGLMMRLGGPGGASEAHVILDVRPTGDIEFMTRSRAGESTTFLATVSQHTPVWLKLSRSGTVISGSVSTDGIHWMALGSTSPDFAEMEAGNGYLQAGLVVTSHDVSKLNTSTFDNVASIEGLAPGALPQFWANHDVGDTGRAGSAVYDGGIFTVRGAGSDIWATSDAFQHVYQHLNQLAPADGEYRIQHAQVVARLTSMTNTNAFAKAGVMIRDSAAPGSAHVILDVRPTGDIEFMTRASTGDSTTYVGGTNLPLPVWLKLVRSNETVTGYVSSDGVDWTPVGHVTAALSNSATELGPVVTSHDRGALNEATFDHVEVRFPE